MSKKKIAILVIVLLAVAAGTVYGLMKLRKANTKAYVQPVSDLNNTWALESGSSSGTITQSAYQKITLSEEESVAEVFVDEGMVAEERFAGLIFQALSTVPEYSPIPFTVIS